MPVSLTEWLGADNWTTTHGHSSAVKAALLYEVEQVLQERDRQNRKIQQEHKLEKEAMKPSGVSLPFSMGGIDGYLK